MEKSNLEKLILRVGRLNDINPRIMKEVARASLKEDCKAFGVDVKGKSKVTILYELQTELYAEFGKDSSYVDMIIEGYRKFI